MIKHKRFKKNMNHETQADYISDQRSTTAVSDEKRYKPYAEELKKAIEDKKYVKSNIAIIGPYGSGKSSLIKTFDEKFKSPKQNSLYISLASFNNSTFISDVNKRIESEFNEKATVEDEETKSDATIDDKKQIKKRNDEESLEFDKKYVTEHEIEKSILQQFLFKVTHKKLPRSKISRIKERPRLFWTIPLLIGIILLSIGLYYINDKLILWSKSYLSIKISTISSLTIGVFLLLYFSFYTFNFSKIKLKDIEAEFWNENTSLFNKYLDEIIYFFKKTKYEIVYIEDLDRIKNCLPLFVKLRELNFVINNHIEINNKVKFVYALGEKVFLNTEERTKFFDKIITIIPYININNIKSELSSWIAKNSSAEEYKDLFIGLVKEKTELFINNISIFLLDNRLLVNVYEDFINYATNIAIGAGFYELFTLMIYKNLHPLDFSKLFYGKGLLIDAFALFKKVKEEERSKLDKLLVELEYQNEKYKKDFIESINELKLLFAGYISKNYINGSYSNIVDTIDFESVNDTDSFYLFGNMYSNNYGNTFQNINDISKKESGFDFRERYEYIKAKSNSRISLVLKEIEDKKFLRNSILNYSAKQILDNLQSDSIQQYFSENKFIGISISNQYLTENSISLISGTENIYIDNDQYEFLVNVRLGIGSNYDYKLSNPYVIILESSDLTRYSHFSILNYDLIKYMLSHYDEDVIYNKKRNNLIEYLNTSDNKVDEFIKSYFKTQEDSEVILLIKHLKNKLNLWDLANDNIQSIDLIKDVIQTILASEGEFSCSNTKSFVESLNSFSSINELIYTPQIFEKLKSINVKISNISTFENLETVKQLMKFELIKINYRNLAHISKLKGCKEDYLLLNNLFDGKDEEINVAMTSMLNEVLIAFKDSDQEFKESVFKELLLSIKNNIESRKLLIENFFVLLTEIPDVSKEELLVLCEKMSFIKDIDIIYELSKKIEFKYLIKYFEDKNFTNTIPNLSSQKKAEAEYQRFLYNIINLILINDKIPNEIIETLGVDSINMLKISFPTEHAYIFDTRLSKLIEKKLFEYSGQFFDKLLNYNESLNKFINLYQDFILTSIQSGEIQITEKSCESVLAIKNAYNLKQYLFDNYSNLININDKENYKHILETLPKIKLSNEKLLKKLFSSEWFMLDKSYAYKIFKTYLNIFNRDDLITILSKFDTRYNELLTLKETTVSERYFDDEIRSKLINLDIITGSRKLPFKGSGVKKGLLPELNYMHDSRQVKLTYKS